MHRYKIVPQILLILSLINFLLAVPVVLREVRQGCVDMADEPENVIPVSQSEKRSDELDRRWDEYSDEPGQKRGSSSGSSPAPSVPVGEPPAGQELAPNSPQAPSPQTGTSRIQDAESASPPEINKLPPSDEDYPSSSGESFPSDHGGYTSSENYYASDEGGPGRSKSYPPWNRPGELASDMAGPWSTESSSPSDGPDAGPDLASNEGGPGSSVNHPLSNRPEIASTRPTLEPLEPSGPFPGWDPHDWSDSSSEAEPEPKKNFMSEAKNFFDKAVYKFKFWPRGPGVL